MKTLKSINAAFTLVEVMVSSALIVVIMGFLMYTMEQTQRTMRGADSRVGQFQTARVAYEALTRNLSQATLNTYWDLDAELINGKMEPKGYRRNSDLHFVSGLAASDKILQSTENINPTHAVFFQAPLGVTYQDDSTILTSSGYQDVEKTDSSNTSKESIRKYRFLNGLMNVCGYYIKWGEDPLVPTFMKPDIANDVMNRRYRYRLMEVTQPAETVTIYNNQWYQQPGLSGTHKATATSGARALSYTNATDWIKVAIGKTAPTLGPATDYSHPLADNIVALIIVPKIAQGDRKVPTSAGDERLDDLSDNYEYDSRPQKVYDASLDGGSKGGPSFIRGTAQIDTLLTKELERQQYAQLPPIIQVTVVAIDEDSGSKLEASLTEPKDGPSEHWAKGLFTKLGKVEDFQKDLGDPINPSTSSLLDRLSGRDTSLKLPKMNFRIFTTDVVMRSAKWSSTRKK